MFLTSNVPFINNKKRATSVQESELWFKYNTPEIGLGNKSNAFNKTFCFGDKNPLPNKFNDRFKEDNFKNVNKFSEHDNRNVIQSFGEYFGKGYGKKQYDNTFYRTSPTHLAHDPSEPQNYESSTKYHFQRAQPADLNLNPMHRRFPKNYTDKRVHHHENKNIITNDFPEDPLAQPHRLQRIMTQTTLNPWKYSYKKDLVSNPHIKLLQIRKSCVDLSKY